MKLAITLAESIDGEWFVRTENGDWLCIGNPLKAIKEQKEHIKELTVAGGVEGEMEFTRAMVISNKRMELRKRFDPSMPDKIKVQADRTKKLQAELAKKAESDKKDDDELVAWHSELEYKDLVKIAKDECGITKRIKKDELIDAIEKARAEKAESDKNPDEGDE